MFLAVLVACPVWGWLPDASANGVSKTGPRPGEKNPMTPNRNSLFCDDELLMLVGYPGDHKVDYTSLVPTNADLSEWSAETHAHTFLGSEYGLINNNAPHWAAASGRITNALHDQVAYAFYRPDGKVQVELWDYPDRLAHYVTLEGTTGTYQYVDIAVGDLDLVVDDNGYYHDEIVVARTTGDSVQVDVLDQNLHSLASASVPANRRAHSVAVAIGDFDSGENLEFAVAQMGESTEYQIDLFRCLKKATTYTKNIECGCKCIDMAAGDFNGDGTDEIAVFAGGDECGCYCYFHFLDVDQDLKLQLKQTWTPGLAPSRLGIVSGLFKYDPDDPDGYGITRRQVAAYAREGFYIYYYTIYLDNDLKPHRMGFKQVSVDQDQADVPIGLSAGNFVGHQGENTSPLMDIETSYPETFCDKEDEWHDCISWARVPKLEILTPSLENKYTWTGSKHDPQCIVPMAVVAYDKDGDTYRLGPPAHITIEDLIGLDYVVQEPPKHVDYLPKNPDDPEDEWNWDVINVSAQPEFYVEFKDEQEQTVATKTTATSSWDIGGSAELDVKGTVSAGVGDIEKASFSAESDTKIGYDYNSSKSKYNSDYHSRSVSYTSQTNEDDYLHGKIQLIDIWRYPVYGYDTGDPNNPHGFQEIILPGPKVTFGSGGRNHADWYQPIHQNRNVLSYPSLNEANFPSDLGSFKLPDGTELTEIMNDGTIRAWDGNKWDIDVEWTDTAGSGSAKTYNHTLSESEDITIGASAKVSFLEVSGEVEKSVKLSFHNKNSWGGSKTEDTTNSKSTGIYIHIPEKPGAEYAYKFKSAIYVSSGGGMFKVAHATDPTGSDLGAGWWKSQYARKPDPALNLPNRFEWVKPPEDPTGYWTLVEKDTRKRMRGFFLRDSKKNPVSGEHDLLGKMHTDGDVVRVCARVYNFSISKTTGDFDVRFEYVPFDTENHVEIGKRVLIGDAPVSLNPLEMQEIYFGWNTTGRSDMSEGDAYRIYVTLDPNNEVDEIHEWKDAQGNLLAHGNNEGYWPWTNGITIAPKPPKPKESMASKAVSDVDISMHDLSLAIKMDSEIVSQGPVLLTVDEHYMLRAHIVSNGYYPHYRYALFYDGDPENGGELIASKAVRGVVSGDNYIWAEWTPKKPGNYELWVVVLEDSDDPNPGNNTDTLEVEVVEAGDSWFQNVIREME